ncbi:CdaR family transcriptional regulator [Desulfosporosinus sp. BICA1-9]|uniref:PucR family transcriptional regulator n=1 Tax=Desulfosporosinus sp. BICA1-9 TaxID=1531958 RepID=UPI00054B5BB6|nr:helix-turn-helix domain-containing protein [Desulfosporosinus sp. BICA1-9]KJS47680.1 MAG: hypothetical protein VR66_18315 [Peptococcaceae bacterium BRH_c23]KJS80229.1 MAG: hypothetical protein JL57_28550 [Desulfosporosinus sp. BICA1-9]HBW38485.1 hypothetical protein [Desulfosporosinus sp.]
MKEYHLQTKLLEALSRGEGLPSLAKILMEFFKNPIIVTDPFGKILIFQVKTEESFYFGEFFPLSGVSSQLKSGEIFEGNVLIQEKEPHVMPYVALPLYQDGLDGYVIIILSRSPWNREFAAGLKESRLALLVAMRKQKELQEIQLQYKNEFLHDLLYNNFENRETIIQRARSLGLDLSCPHVVAVIELDAEENLEEEILDRLQDLWEVYLAQHWPKPILARRGMALVLLLPFDKNLSFSELKLKIDVFIPKIKQDIYPRLPVSFSIGIGHIYAEAEELYRSYQEAKTALELGRFFDKQDEITYYDELGILALLYRIGEQELKTFCFHTLRPLLNHDKEQDGQLMETLRTYFRCNGDLTITAQKLYIHVNTLRYRLKKVQDLLGMNLTKLSVQFNLDIALRIIHQKKWK